MKDRQLRETVVRTGNLQPHISVAPLSLQIGLTPGAGGRSSRPNQALTCLVTGTASPRAVVIGEDSPVFHGQVVGWCAIGIREFGGVARLFGGAVTCS